MFLQIWSTLVKQEPNIQFLCWKFRAGHQVPLQVMYTVTYLLGHHTGVGQLLLHPPFDPP